MFFVLFGAVQGNGLATFCLNNNAGILHQRAEIGRVTQATLTGLTGDQVAEFGSTIRGVKNGFNNAA